jgi:crotonobetainyl-CoA:carnitine CoA-transferase CaiB-like acyl-CoA transferase
MAAGEKSPMDTLTALAALWRNAALPEAALARLDLPGSEPALPSSFAVGTAAQAAIAAAALAADEIRRLRTGHGQAIRVPMRHAAAEFRSERYFLLDGKPAPEGWDRIAGLYPCRTGWVRLHTNFPHHRDGVLRLLGCEYDRAAVAAALAGRDAAAFEVEAAAAGLCVSAYRSTEAWNAHPQAAAVAAEPVVAIERIGDAPPEPIPTRLPLGADRPLAGLRVLEMTRIIAGPVCGRTLAAHGADVLLITAPHLPAVAPLVIDTGRGKLSAQLDLRAPGDQARIAALLRQTDIFVQGYRPGALAGLGLAPGRLAALRPGIVQVSLAAWGHTGPWAGRRGFDSLVQTATGINADEAEAAGSAQPRPLPAQALDHASGYLMAFGALAALHRRATEGGSWHVRVSLARTGLWLRALGRVPGGLAAHDPGAADIADLLEETESGFGRLAAIRHAADMAETPARWARPSVPLGTHAPEWPA